MAANVTLDMRAFKTIMRGDATLGACLYEADAIRDQARRIAPRTGDRGRIKPASKNAGRGYTHYQDGLTLKYHRTDVARAYLEASHHWKVLEYGAARWGQPARHVLTRALQSRRVA